jgi:hypothetical protein
MDVMVMRRRRLARRTFLRGVGAAVALPWLDAMVPALGASPRPGLRLGFVYVPNGVFLPNWVPTGEETTFELSRTLKALEPVKSRMVLVTGLSNRQAAIGAGGGAHSKCSTAWLSGTYPKETEGADIAAGPTIDQVAAEKLGEDTALRSLEIAAEYSYMQARCDSGFSCVYTNTFSWRTSTTPMPMEDNPRIVFERLFGDGGSAAERLAQARTDRSILDAVTEEIATLKRRLGPADTATVTEYLDAVRDVERRIVQQEKQGAETLAPVGAPPIGVPEAADERIKLMLDLQLLAYQADVTRVVSFQMGREQSQAMYPSLGVPEAHHNISHHQNNPVKTEWLTRINTYHIEMFSRMVQKMAATPDGDGSLLDHALLLYGGGMGDGDIHSTHDLPALVVGGGNGRVKRGRLLKAPLDTPMMNLGLTLLDAAGVRLDRFADSTGPLEL